MVQYNTLPREKYFEMSEAIQYVKGMLIASRQRREDDARASIKKKFADFYCK